MGVHHRDRGPIPRARRGCRPGLRPHRDAAVGGLAARAHEPSAGGAGGRSDGRHRLRHRTGRRAAVRAGLRRRHRRHPVAGSAHDLHPTGCHRRPSGHGPGGRPGRTGAVRAHRAGHRRLVRLRSAFVVAPAGQGRGERRWWAGRRPDDRYRGDHRRGEPGRRWRSVRRSDVCLRRGRRPAVDRPLRRTGGRQRGRAGDRRGLRPRTDLRGGEQPDRHRLGQPGGPTHPELPPDRRAAAGGPVHPGNRPGELWSGHRRRPGDRHRGGRGETSPDFSSSQILTVAYPAAP